MTHLRHTLEFARASGHRFWRTRGGGAALGVVLRLQLIRLFGATRGRDGISISIGWARIVSIQLGVVLGRLCGAVGHGLDD